MTRTYAGYMVIFLSAASLDAHATLTLVDNGLGMYDSGLNATWTSDANLLGTMEANAIANGDANAGNLITAIINASGGVIHDTPNGYDSNGTYTLSAADFTTVSNPTGGVYQGGADWWGSQAFVNYLNSIDYGNSNQWALSTTDTACGANYNCTNSQLGELYYNELGGTANGNMPASSLISNEQNFPYWTGTEYSSNPNLAWAFTTLGGYQNYASKEGYQFFVWAVSPAQMSAVPLPGAVWLFGTGYSA